MEILPVKRPGMLTFAGVILVIAGSFHLLDGVVALANDEYFRADELLFGDLSAWVLVAVRRPAAGVGGRAGHRPQGNRPRARRAEHPRSALFLNVVPGWAEAIMVLDVIVIWALCAHADEFQ